MTKNLPETKRADELKPGDWTVGLGATGVDFNGFGPAEILSTHPFTADNGVDRVLVVLAEAELTGPQSIRVDAASNVILLTEAQIAEQRADEARRQVARDLYRLAGLIMDHKLPLPRMGVDVSFRVETIDEVRHAVESLGLEIGPWNRDKGATASWPRGRVVYEAGVHASWFCFSGSLEESKTEPVAEPEPATDDPTGVTFTRNDLGEADDPTPVSPARVPAHIGEAESHIARNGRREDDETPVPVVTRELVDETPVVTLSKTPDGRRVEHADGGVVELISAPDQLSETGELSESITVHFSFGAGHADPVTGESLHRKYVTIVGPSHEACRKAMFASKYGRKWGTDYLAGTSRADQWIPQWTEHERIVLDAATTEPDEPLHYRGFDNDSSQVACGVPIDDIDSFTTRPGSATCPACIAAVAPVSEAR